MASEANELTFVRCPTCRSLVPASAARCRICNASLESKKDSDDLKDQPTESGRVRQRTVSAKPEEVEKIAAGVMDTEPEGESGSGVTSGDFDPLGAFLDELDAGDLELDEPVGDIDSPAHDAESFQEQSGKDDDASGLGGSEELAADDSFSGDDAKSATTGKFQLGTVEEERSSRERGATSVGPLGKDSSKFSQKREHSGSGDRHLAPRGVKPRFGAKLKRQEKQGRERSGQTGRHQDKQRVLPKNESVGSSPMPNKPIEPAVAKQQVRETQRKESTQQVSAEGGEQRTKPVSMLSTDGSVSTEEQSVRRGKMRAGRLSGWLVSYENRDGRAIELRAGRFFITGTSIRDSDLILEDQSMSTPHALVSITDSRLLIQDLMSERGTFIRSQGDAQYRREESVIEVQHGDWIRFGDVEFLVVLVPE